MSSFRKGKAIHADNTKGKYNIGILLVKIITRRLKHLGRVLLTTYCGVYNGGIY